MFLFSDPKLLSEIYGTRQNDNQHLIEWLNRPPGFTTFRVNKLKSLFTFDVLQQTFREQAEYLKIKETPKYSFIQPDCVLVERWPAGGELPEVSGEVIVDTSCGAAVLRGAHVFAPGVMGMSADIKKEQLVNVYADIKSKCKKGLKIKFEEEKLFVGIGKAKMLRSDLFIENGQATGIAIEVIMPASRLPVVNESIGDNGQLLLQNLPSIVCGWVMDPKPGEYILDMCAAPGNKTTHLAELSNNEASIIAFDKTATKVAKVKENCHRHGVTCVQSYVQDSTKCLSLENVMDNQLRLTENSFDKVLLDAPCSALGQRPQIINKMSVKMLQSYKFLQRRLFSIAVRLVKPGGILVYSTCTISKGENESLVAWALHSYPDMMLVTADPLLGGPGWAGCGLDDQQRLKVQRFGYEDDPLRKVDDIYRDTVGFFIAKFMKKETLDCYK